MFVTQQNSLGAPKISLQGWQLVSVTIMLLTGNISIAVTQMALGVALMLQLVRVFGRQEPWPRIQLFMAVALLAGWALVMIPFSSDASQSLLFYRRFYLFAALWVTAGVANTEFRRAAMLTAMVLGAAAISIFAMVKVFVERGSLFTKRLGEMSNPMTSGCLLMMVLLVCVGVLLTRGVSRRTRLLTTVAALPIFVGLLQTMTRSAFLGLGTGLVVMIVVLRPRYTVWVLLICILGILLLPTLADHFFIKGVADRFQFEYFLEGKSTASRLQMWQGGWEIIKHNPWLGVGDRDLAAVAPFYYGDENTTYYGHLHSNLVMFAVIWGWPGFLLVIHLLGRMLALLLSAFRRGSQAPLAAGWLLGAIGVWVAFFVAGLTEWYFGDAESMQLFLAITGIALGSAASNTGENHGR